MQDPILAGLLNATRQSTDLALPVTVMSSGLVAEGLLVSEARWLDELAALLETGSDALVALGGIFRDARAAVELATAAGDSTGGIVHLMGAAVRSGEHLVATGLWRVTLEAVDGWKLGSALPERLRAVEG